MTRRDRILLLVVGPLGFLLLFYYFIYVPRQAEYERLRTQLEQQQVQLKRMEETARQITRLREEFARLQAFIAEVEAKLPAQKDVPALLVQLERLTRSLGIDFEVIRPSQLQPGKAAAPPAGGATPPTGGAAPAPASPPPPYIVFPIGLTIHGTYEQVVRLAASLNDFPRMIAIRNLALQPRQVPDLTVSVDVETYVLPREAR